MLRTICLPTAITHLQSLARLCLCVLHVLRVVVVIHDTHDSMLRRSGSTRVPWYGCSPHSGSCRAFLVCSHARLPPTLQAGHSQSRVGFLIGMSFAIPCCFLLGVPTVVLTEKQQTLTIDRSFVNLFHSFHSSHSSSQHRKLEGYLFIPWERAAACITSLLPVTALLLLQVRKWVTHQVQRCRHALKVQSQETPSSSRSKAVLSSSLRMSERIISVTQSLLQLSPTLKPQRKSQRSSNVLSTTI